MCDSHLHLATKNHLKKMLSQISLEKCLEKNHNTQLINF